MCVACLQYTKDKLNVNEFRSAMREMTIEDKAHGEAVKRLLEMYADKPEELKKRLKELENNRD